MGESKLMCPGCGVNVDFREDGAQNLPYRPCDEQLVASTWDVPFFCTVCGAITLIYKAIRDIVFVYPLPRPKVKHDGVIIIPEGVNLFREDKKAYGVVLSIGPGYHGPTFRGNKPSEKESWHSTSSKVGQLVLFNGDVPWRMGIRDSYSVHHDIPYMTQGDILVHVEGDPIWN